MNKICLGYLGALNGSKNIDNTISNLDFRKLTHIAVAFAQIKQKNNIWIPCITEKISDTVRKLKNKIISQNADTKIILSNVKKQPRRVLHNAFLKEGIDFHTISIASSFQNALKITRRYLKNKEQEEKLPAAEKTEENV